jgi:hypothetical protein
MINPYRFYTKSLKGTDNLEDLGIDGSKLLKWKLTKESTIIWIELNWLRLALSG